MIVRILHVSLRNYSPGTVNCDSTPQSLLHLKSHPIRAVAIVVSGSWPIISECEAIMRRWLKEPFMHFLILGGLLFIAYGWVNRGDEPEVGRIVVTQGKIEHLRAGFSRTWQRPPSPAELDGLIQDYVREEVFVREARALGLDRDDTVVRRRLRQKVEFVTNDLAGQAEPDESELREFLAKHPDLFQTEPRVTFRQVYLNPDLRRDRLQQDVAKLLADLNRADGHADFRTLGDSTMLNPGLENVPTSETVRQFGEEFTRQLEEIPIGDWHGPVTSGYGVHLVQVKDRKDGRMLELAEVREQVASAWADARRREENERLYQALLKQYTVTIEKAQLASGKSQNSSELVQVNIAK